MAPRARVESRLPQVRKSRGISAADLARRVGVSRQTVYAIEAGTYVPNTEVALRLSRELEVSVDDLFALPLASPGVLEPLNGEVLGAVPSEGQAVRVCRVDGKWVGVPVSASPYYLPEADGIVKRRAGGRIKRTGGLDSGRGKSGAELMVFAKNEAARRRLLLAGCDPAANLLTRMVEKDTGVEIVTAAASSRLSLTWLKEGKVHIAGSHLEDPKTGEFNLPFVRREFPSGETIVLTFARWEEGLLTAPGNPKRLRAVEDLARKNVRFMNREEGSGARALLDRLLAKVGMSDRNVRGYEQVAFGHLAAAYGVLSGAADACLATRSAAQIFGLHFIPLRSERYDFVMRRRVAELPAVRAFLDVLQRATLRRKLEVLAGYDTSQMGRVVG